jgi:hypothetical protein
MAQPVQRNRPENTQKSGGEGAAVYVKERIHAGFG